MPPLTFSACPLVARRSLMVDFTVDFLADLLEAIILIGVCIFRRSAVQGELLARRVNLDRFSTDTCMCQASFRTILAEGRIFAPRATGKDRGCVQRTVLSG